MKGSGSKSTFILGSNTTTVDIDGLGKYRSLHQIEMEVNSYELRKHLVIWLLVGGASFGEKTLLFPMIRSRSQKLN